MKKELVVTFELVNERERDNTKLLNLKQGKDFQTYAAEFMRLAERLEKSETDKLDLFLLGLDQNTRMLVRLQKCETFAKALKVASIITGDTTEKPAQMQRYQGQCTVCMRTGHNADQCYRNTKRLVTGGEGYSKAEELGARGFKKKDKDELRKGTSSVELTTENEPSKKPWMNNTACFYCKKEGHISRFCPKLVNKQNNLLNLEKDSIESKVTEEEERIGSLNMVLPFGSSSAAVRLVSSIKSCFV